MIPEQAVLKAPGFEIPMIAFDDWRFWILVFLSLIFLLILRKK